MYLLCYTLLYNTFITFDFDISGPHVQVRAHYCYVGQERDRSNNWRWVLPYEDPCSCTSVRFSGLNIVTPERHFDPLYYDIPMISDDIMEIRDYYGLQCKGKRRRQKRTGRSIGKLNAKRNEFKAN